MRTGMAMHCRDREWARYYIRHKIQVAKTKIFERCTNLKPHKIKVQFYKVYCELLLFSFLPGLHIKTLFHSRIPGVAILLLESIALYVRY